MEGGEILPHQLLAVLEHERAPRLILKSLDGGQFHKPRPYAPPPGNEENRGYGVGYVEVWNYMYTRLYLS